MIYSSVKFFLLILFTVISDEGRKPFRSFYSQVVRKHSENRRHESETLSWAKRMTSSNKKETRFRVSAHPNICPTNFDDHGFFSVVLFVLMRIYDLHVDEITNCIIYRRTCAGGDAGLVIRWWHRSMLFHSCTARIHNSGYLLCIIMYTFDRFEHQYHAFPKIDQYLHSHTFSLQYQ